MQLFICLFVCFATFSKTLLQEILVTWHQLCQYMLVKNILAVRFSGKWCLVLHKNVLFLYHLDIFLLTRHSVFTKIYPTHFLQIQVWAFQFVLKSGEFAEKRAVKQDEFEHQRALKKTVVKPMFTLNILTTAFRFVTAKSHNLCANTRREESINLLIMFVLTACFVLFCSRYIYRAWVKHPFKYYCSQVQ